MDSYPSPCFLLEVQRGPFSSFTVKIKPLILGLLIATHHFRPLTNELANLHVIPSRSVPNKDIEIDAT